MFEAIIGVIVGSLIWLAAATLGNMLVRVLMPGGEGAEKCSVIPDGQVRRDHGRPNDTPVRQPGEISFLIKLPGNAFGGDASATFYDAGGRRIRGPLAATLEGQRVVP
jgi:hypothetical protein